MILCKGYPEVVSSKNAGLRLMCPARLIFGKFAGCIILETAGMLPECLFYRHVLSKY